MPLEVAPKAFGNANGRGVVGVGAAVADVKVPNKPPAFLVEPVVAVPLLGGRGF